MAAVMTLMGRGSDWATAKKALGEANFLGQVSHALTFRRLECIVLMGPCMSILPP